MIKLSEIREWCIEREYKSYTMMLDNSKLWHRLLRENSNIADETLKIIWVTWREYQENKSLLEHTLLVLTTLGFEVDYEG